MKPVFGGTSYFLALVNARDHGHAQAQPDVAIVAASHGIFARAMVLFAQRADEAWSLSDCTSFVVMRVHSLESALTADQHFEQAGFRRLMQP